MSNYKITPLGLLSDPVTGAIIGFLDQSGKEQVGVGGSATAGRVSRAADVTVGRAFVSTDYGVGVVPLNAGTVQNFTVNTAATSGITGTGNLLPIQILGAVHTLTAGVGVTITYGATSYTNGPVTGFVPVLNQTYVLTQRGTTDVLDLS